MTSYLFRNVSIWDGINDQEYPGEVVVENNRIKTVARGRNAIGGERIPLAASNRPTKKMLLP